LGVLISRVARVGLIATAVALVVGGGFVAYRNLEGCNLIGCLSTFTLEVRFANVTFNAEPYQVEVCLNRECVSETVSVGQAVGGVSLTAGGTLVLTERFDRRPRSANVTVRISQDDEPVVERSMLVGFTVHRPNGPWCEPVCYHASVVA
jgi:hypothetical protein